MAAYGFIQPILPGKTEKWKAYINEMTGPRAKELKESRKRVGMTKVQVWLQKTPWATL